MDVHLDVEIIEKRKTVVQFEDLDVHLDVINFVKHMQKWTSMRTNTWGST